MPPSAKFTKREVLEAAQGIVRTRGIEALTSRALGQALNSSARPIFTVFDCMEQVKAGVTEAACRLYRESVACVNDNMPSIVDACKCHILFAEKEPQLFRLLFMSESTEFCDAQTIGCIAGINEKTRSFLKIKYLISDHDAQRICRSLWLYAHGIAAAQMSGGCMITGEESENLLSEVFLSLIKENSPMDI